MKRIAVLTSGGDAPGMNAAIRAVVRAGTSNGVDVVGISRGYWGLVHANSRPLDRAAVVDIIHRGGTMLGTGRCEEFTTEAGMAQAVETSLALGIDGLILIGGDGTFRGASALLEAGGPPTIGIPATIDNDVFGTSHSLGFDTAVNTALHAIDRIRDTATSHEMLHFVEVMGHNSDWLAVTAGLAGGAEAVLGSDTRDITPTIMGLRRSLASGKRSIIVVVCEGLKGGVQAAAARIGPELGLDYRVTSLGHIQRGGSPTAADRVLGGQLGVAAVDALQAGTSGVMVGTRDHRLCQTALESTWAQPNPIPQTLQNLLVPLS